MILPRWKSNVQVIFREGPVKDIVKDNCSVASPGSKPVEELGFDKDLSSRGPRQLCFSFLIGRANEFHGS